MAKSDDPFKGSGMLVVTSRRGSIYDPCRPAAQILRSSSSSRTLAEEEVVDILQGAGIEKLDASRLFRDMLKKGYLRKL